MVLATVEAALAELEEELIAPEGETSLLLLQAIYKDKKQPLTVRMRSAIAALPFEVPKLSVSAHTTMDEKSFAAQLERCIERSKSLPLLNPPKTIEHEQLVSADELKRPFPRNYRRF